MALFHDIFPDSLHTDRSTLTLLSGTAAEYDCFLAALNSPTAHSRMGDFGIQTHEDIDKPFSDALLRAPYFKCGKADRCGYYMIHLGPNNPEGELIGGVHIVQKASKLPPDLGWCLLEPCMWQGYATEAAKELMRCVQNDLGEGKNLEELIVFADEKNQQSNRVAEKLGFVDGGRCPNLDSPGMTYNVMILPGMERVDERCKEGIRLRGSYATPPWSTKGQDQIGSSLGSIKISLTATCSGCFSAYTIEFATSVGSSILAPEGFPYASIASASVDMPSKSVAVFPG
ncbi:hypothetical protein AC579_2385 [Pseudocercospora musae]|uniref:N-acetyltransferase domain-containing protein n=1 Tax=Pseudocercospora musae TaxID=113226 RepID=A0A139IH67_9PEZI|nr:hypothetical protein AC579_2385 [Pseudocercospora musae]